MFVRVIRTSVSIFRSIRPQKPILFDFHFFGYGNFTNHCKSLMISYMLDIPGGQKWKNQISRKIANCYAQNFTNMFVRVVRTSVSIFRSIRSQKPILFDFHFFGYGNFTDHCKSYRNASMLDIPSGQKLKNQISRKVTNCNAQNFTNMFVRVVLTSVSIFRSIRPQKPILLDFHFFRYGNFTDHYNP